MGEICLRGRGQASRKLTYYKKLALLLVIMGATGITGCSAATGYSTQGAPQSAASPPSAYPLNSRPGPAQPLPAGLSFTTIALASTHEGFVAGDGFIYATTDGGKGWRRVYSGHLQIDQFDFVNPHLGFVLADAKPTGSVAPGAPVLLVTQNGGRGWTRINGSLPAHTTSLRFFGRNSGFAQTLTGSQLESWETIDGGANWRRIPLPAHAQASDFSSPRDGWAASVTANGYSLWQTIDAGLAWRLRASVPLAAVLSVQVVAASESEAWFLVRGEPAMNQQAYTLFHTSDEGARFVVTVAQRLAASKLAPGNGQRAATGPGPLAGPLVLAGENSARLVGLSPAVYFGLVSMGYTYNGGSAWNNSKVALQGQSGLMSFANKRNGWLAATLWQGPSNLYKTSDGGRTWFQVYPSLSAQDASSSVFHLAALRYSQADRSRVALLSSELGFSGLLPQTAVAGESPANIQITNSETLKISYPHMTIRESLTPIPPPQANPARFNIRLNRQSIGSVLTTYGVVGNQTEPVLSLYTQSRGIWVMIEDTVPGQNLTYLQLKAIADSLRPTR